MDDPFWRMAPTVDLTAARMDDLEVDSVRLACLWCDQGMAHVLQAYDEDVNLIALSVFDFGAEQMFKSSILREAQAAPAVNYLIERLLRLPEPRIEYFVISHQDTDHWSLVKYFLDEIEELGIDLVVGKLYYGGADWGPGAKAQMQRLGKYADEVAPQTVRFSDYSAGKGTPTKLGSIGDITLHTLMVNAPVASSSASIRKNGTSAVIVIKFGEWMMILPGDATWETLEAANTTLAKWTKSPVTPCWVLSVPHHGSLATIVPDSSAAKLNFKATETFVGFCKARSTVASAGVQNSFRHPYINVIRKFSSEVWAGGFPTDEHPFVAYNPDVDDWERIPPTVENIYTTVVSHGVIPILVANWYFDLNPGGETITYVDVFNGATKATVSIDDYEDMETGEEQWWDDDEEDALLLAARQAFSGSLPPPPTPTARVVTFEKLDAPRAASLAPPPPPAPRPATQVPRPTRVTAPPPPKKAGP